MTNPAHLSGPRHLDSLIVTPSDRPSIGTLQKHMPTLTRTATNQTAGPLGGIASAAMTDFITFVHFPGLNYNLTNPVLLSGLKKATQPNGYQ